MLLLLMDTCRPVWVFYSFWCSVVGSLVVFLFAVLCQQIFSLVEFVYGEILNKVTRRNITISEATKSHHNNKPQTTT
jgi:hypothetical protein